MSLASYFDTTSQTPVRTDKYEKYYLKRMTEEDMYLEIKQMCMDQLACSSETNTT